MPPIKIGKDQSSDSSDDIDDFKTGPELKMNIFNLKRVQEVHDWEVDEEKKFEETDEEEVKWESDGVDDLTNTNTSITEAWNDKFKKICSEILESFIYLGSDFLA